MRWPWVAVALLLLAFWLLKDDAVPPVVASASAAGGIPCPSPPGAPDPLAPTQSPLPPGIGPIALDGATLTPLAGFALQARVLSREDYSLGREADFSPTDLALGWGPMAEAGLADRLDVSQGGRWYRYRWGAGGPPMAPNLIAVNSANMHMVPADATVARRLAAVRPGQVLRLRGWLLRIDDASGWHWVSSTRRDDTGNGACELVLVCAIDPGPDA